MKWVVLKFNPDKNIRPSTCHPKFVGARKDYIKSVYGEDPISEGLRESIHFDFGGMIHVNDPYAKVALSKSGDREFTCYEHHADLVVDQLEETLKEGPKQQDKGFYRIQAGFGSLIFLSESDIKKILKALKHLADPTIRMLHTQAMKEALVEAAMVNRPPAEEPAIRKILGAKEVN